MYNHFISDISHCMSLSKIWFIVRVLAATAIGLFGISYLVNPGIYEIQLTPFADNIHRIMIIIHATTGGLTLILGVWQLNDKW